MAKTYNSLSSVTVGSVLTASDYNKVLENSNNYRVPPMARIRRASSQNVANTTDTILSWTDMDFDTDSMWAAGSADRLTVTTPGIYLVVATVSFIASSTGERIAWIQKNGSGSTRFGQIRTSANSTANENAVSISAFVDCALNDYLQVGVYQSAGTGTATVLGSGTSPTNLSVKWLGQKT